MSAKSSPLMVVTLVALTVGRSAQSQEPSTPPPRGPSLPGTSVPMSAPAEPPARAPDPLAEALAPTLGGLTADEVARRAVRTSPSVEAAYAQVRSAEAQIDQAFVAYFPVLKTSFGYTRLSKVSNELSLGTSPIPGIDTSYEFPVILNNWSWTTSLGVPVSDYLLRLTQSYASASHSERAKRLEAEAKSLQVSAEAKTTFLNWARSRGHSAVAVLAVDQARAHLGDARKALEVGRLSKADILRLEAQLAQAEHLARASRAVERTVEQQLRIVLHLPPDAPIALGLDIMADPALIELRPLDELERAALARRLELKATQASRESLAEAEAAGEAGYFPRLDGFFSTTYAKPNSRIFPQVEEWDFTWEAGALLSWTANETFATLGRDKQIESQAAELAAREAELRDGIRIAVAAAYGDVHVARSAILAAGPREVAAAESLRVRGDLLRVGEATATDMVDAETELTQARLQRVDAHVDSLIALVKLEHAIGGKPGEHRVK